MTSRNIFDIVILTQFNIGFLHYTQNYALEITRGKLPQYFLAHFFVFRNGSRREGEQMQTEYTQDFIQTITCVEDMQPIAKSIVENYCIDNGINEADIFPSIWNDIITELYVILFRPCHNLLRITNTQYNEYDRVKVYYVYENIYKRLCNSHCQEITQKGFLDMTGIDKQTLYNWKTDNKYIYNNRSNSVEHSNNTNESDILGSSRFDLQEKIMEDNEESLFNLMKDRRNNPMKYLPKLNKTHGWNMPGVGARTTEKQALSAAELPKLGNNAQINLLADSTNP